MKNQKNQNSIEKKSKTRKNNVESNRKITDFFSNFLIEGGNTNVLDKNNYHRNGNNIIEDGIEQEEKFIDLYGDFNSSLILNYRNQNENYNYNNSNKKKNKKKKMEEKNFINQKNEIKNFSNNDIFSPSFFINLNTYSICDKNRNIILADLTNDEKIYLHKLNISSKNFECEDDYNESFPFQNCRIININNLSYIIGGKLNDDISKLSHNNKIGTKYCYKILYNKDEKQIKICKISSTIFEHQSHSLLYLPKYNSIVLCSGHKQKNCEYLNLNKKEEPNNWKHLFPLRKSRENAIPLLFNEKYIFLIGGYDSEGKLNEDYNMLNYEGFINGKYQNYWKTYKFEQKTSLLQRKGNGIIYYNNNIYILGGYNLNNDKFISWKINFSEEDKDEQNEYLINKGFNDKIYKISSIELCDNINNNVCMKNKNRNNFSFCFCGEQVFMKYKKFFVNISFGGQLAIIPNNLLD